MPINALLLDDEPMWRDLIKEVLHEEGHTVQPVESLSQARELLAKRDFHLAVIDILLRDQEDGLDLLNDISELNQKQGRFCGPVIFTGNATMDKAIQALRQGAADFLQKHKPEESIVLKRGSEGRGFDEQELLGASRRVLKKVLLERNRQYDQVKYILCLNLCPGQNTQAELSGPTKFSVESTYTLALDVDKFAARADDLQFHFSAMNEEQRLKWRPRAKHIGSDLYEKLFASDPSLERCMSLARTRSRGPFHLVFRGSEGLVRLPLELLPGETGYLILENPLIRQISGITATRERGIDRVFFDETSTIKILLIGSNTHPPIPGVDTEIALLQEALPKFFRARGFNCVVETIPTDEASYDNAYASLERCQYHIVHYAGHGYHDEKHSDESGILFWEKPNRLGVVKPMPIRVLRNLLHYADTRFFYLSCCVGAKGTPEAATKLNGNDFQGIVEGLVRVGIPAVLGYRWNVSDGEANQIAVHFYENLLTDLSLDLALFKARRALQENNYYNETWASPVLVAQNL